MKKKNFKVYEAPAVEIVEVETSVSLLAGSGPGTPLDPDDTPDLGDIL